MAFQNASISQLDYSHMPLHQWLLYSLTFVVPRIHQSNMNAHKNFYILPSTNYGLSSNNVSVQYTLVDRVSNLLLHPTSFPFQYSTSSFFSSWCLPVLSCAILFCIILHISSTSILILQPSPVSLFYAFFLYCSTIVIISPQTILTSFEFQLY